ELAAAGDPARADEQDHEHDDCDADQARPRRRVDWLAEDVDPLFRIAEQDVEEADRDRADDGAPQARDATDDEHRERQEGEVEVDLVRADAAEQVYEQAAREAGQAARERERPEAMPVDV